jgi:methionyl-tRNA formyltransferase
VVLVLTQPERPAGRGLRAEPGAVARLAAQRGLPVFQPITLKSAEAIERLRAARADAIVVAAYGLLLPAAALSAAPLGALNIHASLLPRWRGAAPIQRALLAGDTETGVSIMQLEQTLDTGPVFLARRLPIEAQDDFGTLHDKLAALGAEAIVECLQEIAAGRAQARAQSAAAATYAPKIDKRETRIDWSRPAAELERRVRAFRPAPGAATQLDGESLKLWRVHVTPGRGAPGSVLRADTTLEVACGEGALEIETLQRAGGKPMAAADFLRGKRLAPGARFA